MDHDDLAVGYRRGTSRAVKLMNLLRMAFWAFALGRSAADFLGPDDLALALVDSEQQQLVVRGVRGDKNGVSRDHRRARAPFGQRAFPHHAPLLVPDDRQVPFAADACSFRPAPLRPVGRLDSWLRRDER